MDGLLHSFLGLFWISVPRATCTSQADVLYVQERTPTGVLEARTTRLSSMSGGDVFVHSPLS